MKKVIVGMSGGVDSSVAALLLQQQGYQVEGLFMKNWEQDDDDKFCPAARDLADAQTVCARLGIRLHTVNFAQSYWDNVFTHFLTEYEKGRTPNPDILCNKEIKFKLFLNHALELGADYIVTGHYVRTKIIDGNPALLKGKDRNKDQSYFLYAIEPTALEKSIFPIGDLLKPQVRQIAQEHGLVTHDKKDSTGICFIGEKRFKHFLAEYLLAKPGEIITTCGDSIGQHDGLMYYTYGQRQGLHIGGLKNYDEAPWYVVDKDLAHNHLIVAQGFEHPMLYAQGLMCQPIHWLSLPPELPLQCYAKTRYRQAEQACLVSPAQEETQQRHCVMFAEPQRAITPGQSIVFYDKNRCLGGAVIESIIR